MSGVPLLAVGKILKTQGLRGKVKVSAYTEDPGLFSGKARFYLQRQGQTIPLEIQAVQIQKGSVVLRFVGKDTIDAVHDLVGETIFIDTKDLPEPDENEYYWFQLMGMEVMTENGERVGVIQEIFPTGGNDVYVVRGAGREILIPATREVIQGVDIKARRMIIRPIEGLLTE